MSVVLDCQWELTGRAVGWNWTMQAEAKAALLEGGVLTSEGRKAVDALDRWLREADVSPRGAEVALAAALFVRDLEALRPTRSGREE